MNLHQNDFGIDFLQNFLHQQEGVVRAVVHIAPADEVDDGHGACLGVKHPPAPSGHLGGVIGGPQNLGAVLHVVHDLPLGPGVVAHGNHIRSGVQNVLRLMGKQTHHRGVFSVDHGKIRAGVPFQLPQAAAYPVKSRISHHVAYRQYLKIHLCSSNLVCPLYTRMPGFASISTIGTFHP